ncbi:MAG: hypothetical protein ACOY82_03915 [Pseudomonadota bacterium]
MSNHSNTTSLRRIVFALILLVVPAVHAGPPMLCHPFDTAGAPSLPWSKQGWNGARGDYEIDRLVADTQALLAADTPVIARMETLRRAAIYAARDGAVARALFARLDARIAVAPNARARALALFDAGYFAETVQDIVRLQSYDMPGLGKVDVAALKSILVRGDGSRRIAQAIELAPQDASMRFAAALVSMADQRRSDYREHAAIARAGARDDRLLARNIGQVAN